MLTFTQEKKDISDIYQLIPYYPIHKKLVFEAHAHLLIGAH